jgi:PKD repeat protein
VEFDVSPLVSGDGTYTFVLATDSTDGLQLNSREATTTTLRPQLVVTPAVEPPPAPPLADFSASATRGTAPMSVQFTNLTTGSTPMTQEWDFHNDGTIDSTAKNPSFTYTDPGVYSVRLRVENDLGGDEKIKTDYITVLEPPPPADTLQFSAVADAYVQSNVPTDNRGTGSNLNIDGSPISRGWIRFDVQGVSAPVTQATLRVLGSTGSTVGFAVHGAGDVSWGETTINYSNAPPFSATVVGSSGAYAAAEGVEIDVTDLVTGNGPVSFVLTTPTVTAMSVRARETSTDPQLVVKTGLAAPKTAQTQTHLHSH